MEHKSNLFGSLPAAGDRQEIGRKSVAGAVGETRQPEGAVGETQATDPAPVVADPIDVRDLPQPIPGAMIRVACAISEDAVQRIYLAYATAAGYMGDFYSESAGFQRGFRLALDAAFNEGLRHG